MEAASGTEPLYRALQALYAAANSLVNGYFISPGERAGSERGADQGQTTGSPGHLRRPVPVEAQGWPRMACVPMRRQTRCTSPGRTGAP